MSIRDMVSSLLALFLELLQLALFRRVYFSVTRLWWAGQLVCSKQGFTVPLLVAFGCVLGSAFIQGFNVTLMLMYYLLSWILWRQIHRFLARTPSVMILAAIALVGGSFMVDGLFRWTPGWVIANIIITPIMVIMRCRV